MRIGEYASRVHGHRHDGLAYELTLPGGAPRGGVVVLHGAGSRKENHRDFAQLCAAAGLAAIVFDQRGHGASDGALDDRAIADVATIASLLPAGLRGGRLEFRADRAALEPLVAAQDLEAAARALGSRLLLVHAEGDDRVPCAHSRRLHAAAPGSRLIAVPGGDHLSAQHDPALQAAAVDFLVGLSATTATW